MFTIKEISKQMYLLKDSADCVATLIIGQERALLWDTASGIDDLKHTVQSLTLLPLTIICSHTHFDHIGGSVQYDEVYIPSEDRSILDFYDDEIVNKWLSEMNPSKENNHISFHNWSHMKDIDFNSIDLGDLECHIIPLPGHSKGSIGLYIPSFKVLLGGDALLPIICMIFDHRESLQVQLNTLYKVLEMDFDLFYTSHADYGMDKNVLRRMIHCLETCKGKRFHKYQYPKPPYSHGWFYLDSLEDEPVGLLLDKLDD